TALPGTIQHWSLNLNPPHTRNSGYLLDSPPLSTNTVLEEAHFEAHHIIPLSSTGIRITRLSDLALLCANCHRLLHRAIAVEKRWLTVAEGRAICGIQSAGRSPHRSSGS
ncbi:hypothetical protein DF145_34655, partial [Burkholderia stagnalis]